MGSEILMLRFSWEVAGTSAACRLARGPGRVPAPLNAAVPAGVEVRPTRGVFAA